MQNLFIVPFTTSFLHGNFKFPIYCKVQGLVEMGFIWKDPTSKIFFFFQYIQYVFCYPLTENIHYKQRELYILRMFFFKV